MTVVLITIVHVIVCIFLIVVVLLQSGKSADIAGTFGGMGSQTAFGPRGAATVLSKATTTSAIIFMLTSISLVWLSSRHTTHSVLTGAPVKSQPAAIPVPATAGPAQPASGQPAPLQTQPQMDQQLNPAPPQQTPKPAPQQTPKQTTTTTEPAAPARPSPAKTPPAAAPRTNPQ